MEPTIFLKNEFGPFGINSRIKTLLASDDVLPQFGQRAQLWLRSFLQLTGSLPIPIHVPVTP